MSIPEEEYNIKNKSWRFISSQIINSEIRERKSINPSHTYSGVNSPLFEVKDVICSVKGPKGSFLLLYSVACTTV